MIDSAWEQFTSAELEQKLMVLRELIESCMLTDRSAEYQLTETGIIESELAEHPDAGLGRWGERRFLDGTPGTGRLEQR